MLGWREGGKREWEMEGLGSDGTEREKLERLSGGREGG